MGLLLLIVLVLVLFGSVPAYPYSRGWGYGPSGIVGTLLLILIVLLVLGTLPLGYPVATTPVIVAPR